MSAIVVVIVVVMVVVIVVTVVVIVMLRVLVPAAVRARFRFERRSFETNLGAETAHHGVEHVVVLIAHEAGADLEGYVAVAEMVGHARQ